MRKLSFFNFIIFTLAMTLAACGDFWEGGDPTPARSMTLQRKLVNLMVGDKYKIPVEFNPGEVSNEAVWWQANDTDVATIEDDSVVGISEGYTRIYAMSVSDRLQDSCLVNVFPKIYLNPHNFSYDMVIYADVTIHEHKYTKADEDAFIIAAYHFNELRGIGKMREWQGKPYMEIRVWGPAIDLGTIRLRCYYRGQGQVELFPDEFEFDGEAHGSLSNLYPLVIDEHAEVLQPDSEENPIIDEDDPVVIIVPGNK